MKGKTMNRSFQEALKNRRSRYDLSDKSPVSDERVRDIVEFAVRHVPSSYNSQSTRIMILFGDEHRRLWDIVKDELRKIVPPAAFKNTETKIDNCFRAGQGTVLFYEDLDTIEKLQKDNPLYSDRFPTWSQHTSAMHQFAVWTMLEDEGLGASLQHYNPLIDEAVSRQWNINPRWQLVAQMPFGATTSEPGSKTFLPIEDRIRVAGSNGSPKTT